MAVDWTQLPPEIIETISRKITIYSDYLHFQAVCHAWKSSIPVTPNHLPPQLPWLLLPQSQSNQSSYRAFFNLSTYKFHSLNLPEASHHKKHCGSSHGWLIILDDSPSILVINPLTRRKIHLPAISSFPNVVSFDYANVGREYLLVNPQGELYTASLRQMRDGFLKKVVMSSSPLDKKGDFFVAMAILCSTGDLAYCKNGDGLWNVVENVRSFSEDVIYFNGLFYAVNKAGQIVVCDVNGNSPKVSLIETPRQIGGDLQYLVSSGDGLLLVTRYLDLDVEFDIFIYKTARFEVFKLDLNGPRWERVTSLGDMMLFIGDNSSLALSSSGLSGCTGDCIYYTDDYSANNYDGHVGEHDLGIFKLSDGSIEPLPCYPRNSYSRLQCPPPLWISPNPC
ncbi:hypothetical protein OIU76_006569 [Salix suchowensis]|uniref:KIB1-4 beta-propeller domain-containing protein n=1 Tax=Salix suchowensis TaxID=1278906 RepID=A0ABQ9BYS9_9ROSI|nr:hypothetical protein OIU78_012894 [Salix suchowensis]KAJ6336717.1 hypothetical protein OIU76_006569 [Salix suchowensis]KAJ6392365.1 hypothetical protein OIU77_026177 [Salix suchowensis]